MIIGHLGLALGARAIDPKAPLSWLVLASLAPDLVDVAIAATGACNPAGVYTHSLASIGGTAVVLGVAAAWRSKRRRTGLVIAAVVVAHILVDYLTGTKALWIGGPEIGLNLYQWGWADFAVELPVIVGGWWAARRWGDVPRWVSSRFMVIGLVGVQLLADAVPNRQENAAESVCAKAELGKGLRRFF